MSRLFSRLENIHQGSSDNDATVPWPEADAQPEAASPAASHAGTGAAPPAADTGTMPPLVPGYAISSSLPMAPAPAVSRPVWPVRLWLFSLLLLLAIALFMLLLPERLYSRSSQRPAPAVQTVPQAQPARAPRPEPRTDAAAAARMPAQPAAACSAAMAALNLCNASSP